MIDLDKIGTTSILMFNLVLEAKVGAMVIMAKKVHPDWSKEQIAELLHSAIDYAVNHYNG